MTGRHQLLAAWKNPASLARSLRLAAAAVEAFVGGEDLFLLSVCPSMTSLAPVARVSTDQVAVTAQNMGWDDPAKSHWRKLSHRSRRHRPSVRDPGPL